MNGPFDSGYRDRVAAAVWQSILAASLIEGADGARTVVIQNSECISALIRIMGLILASSEVTSSPTKLRGACDDIVKRLRAWTSNARKEGAVGKVFDHVVSSNEGHA